MPKAADMIQAITQEMRLIAATFIVTIYGDVVVRRGASCGPAR